MTKLKFVSNWGGSDLLHERLKRNWEIPDFVELVENDYDYLVIFNTYPKIRETKYHRNIGFILEPSWSPYFDYDLRKYCRYVFTNKKVLNFENVINSQPIQFSHDSTSSSFSYKDRLEDNNLNKKNKMSIIVSNWNWGDKSHNYFWREELVRRILDSDLDIHIYGKNWSINDERYKGSPANKKDGLKDYEFSIAIENSFEDSYVTEKLFDCYLYNTVPLYCGTNTVNNFYDKSSLIEIDIRSEGVLNSISDVYYNYSALEYAGSVMEQKKRYFNDYNVFRKLNEAKLLT